MLFQIQFCETSEMIGYIPFLKNTNMFCIISIVFLFGTPDVKLLES